ncbi:tetratricopeptide repeat protein [Streptomyces longispororuber]|uniref:tetratricopeptide repeat protein n=1 Tax=Streptomyces longispororuber TaxID=68230 RepID=UPI00210AD58E|nr:hypothetical protein [Streptomyces longispororuber]MCQ4211054.1 hypothetical protein [Streptomyces longispororuber]
MVENGGRSELPVYERAQSLLRAGELARARAEAQTGLDEHGPQAGLHLVLGRAHAAEDDDEHDRAAERAYRAGLDAFPDDLDLLAAYAEFGLAGDVMEQPGRRARGQAAADRLRELAPGSAQALRLEDTDARRGPRPPSLSYTQRHDARVALNSGVDLAVAAEQAHEAAEAWPCDRRLRVRAETLAALRTEGLACLTLRDPHRTALVLSGVAGVWLLAVPALGLAWPHSLWALAALVPVLREQRVLRGARRRAELRMPAGYAMPAPGAPDVPLPTRRERATLALALVVVAGGLWGSTQWQYARWTDYPHYEASVPKTYRGMPLADDRTSDLLTASMAQAELPPGGTPFSAVYKDEDSGALLAFTGATADLHDEDPDDLGKELSRGYGSAGLTVKSTWSADPGVLGGRLECAVYETVGAELSLCAWADKGSTGMVLVGGDDDRAGLARATRELREATLRPTAGAA